MSASVLRRVNDHLAEVVSNARQSLVHIHSDGRRGGHGAGTLWHADGLVVTNAHVVHSRRMKVTLPDGETYPARLLATDKGRDLAALAIESDDDDLELEFPVVEPGDSRSLQAGDWVIALGHPWGVAGAAAAGVVIGVGRSPEMARELGDFVQVSLQLRPGHSGGPLLAADGRLVGINVMMAGPEVGLAVPVHAVKKFLQQALGSGERPLEPEQHYSQVI